MNIMKSIRLNNSQLKDLAQVGKSRHEAKDISFRNVSKHGSFKKYKTNKVVNLYNLEVTERHIPHIAGVIGEYAYGKFIGEDIDRKIYSVRDVGVDFKNGAEVKTSTFYGGSWGETELKIPKREYLERSPKLYILARLSSEILVKSPPFLMVEILGQISSGKFESIKEVKQYIGGGPVNYVVGASRLDPVSPIEEHWYFK
jgi:hypothetical protein